MKIAKKYRKLPVVVEAFHYAGRQDDFDLMRWCETIEGSRQISFHGDECSIQTLEGEMEVRPGDYIICGVHGELYPCKPDIFRKTYEEVSNENS